MSYKIFSFFSGSGFLDLGFENAGFQIQLVNEIKPAFLKAYMYSREQMGIEPPVYGYANSDINEYLTNSREYLSDMIREARADGSLVGFIGGPPCPDFSVAGKQRGRDGDNGRLTQSYADLIEMHHPDFFLFENVKGLWKTQMHRTFYDEIKEGFRNAGYWLTDRLSNALEFGVPQDRDRILLFGLSREYLHENSNNSGFPWDAYIEYDIRELRGMDWPERTPFHADEELPFPEGIPAELTVEHWFQNNSVYDHPNSQDYFTPKAGLSKMLSIDEGDDSRKSYKRLHRWRYSPIVAYGNNEVHLHPYKARRLSVAEAMSLQSLPREFSLPPDMTLTDKFKTVGNGVPYLLAFGIARTIRDFLNEGR